jgi:glutamate racemase
VPLVEEGWTDGRIAEMTAEKYLQEIRHNGIDTLVLGCTHYPDERDTFAGDGRQSEPY